MRRILVILILVVLLVLSSSPSTVGTSDQPVEDYNTSFVHNTPFDLSSAGDSGTGLTADLYASRAISGLDLSIQNSYASVNTHAGDIDLSGYQISGWNLYKVVVDSTLITATPERESTQITQNSYIQIRNNTGLVSDALYQEFYNQPHDGKLDNYTIIYIAPYYTISLGKAYLVVRSDYTDSSTNETSWTSPFSQGLTDTTLTHDVSSDNAVLNQSTPYYVVLDGTAMTGVYAGGWFFNQLYWRSSSSVLGDETGYHLRGDAWYQYTGISREEAFLDYTYTPWNKTGSSALTYSDPSAISLTGNSSSLTGTSWTFSDPDNVTWIDFSSNQSVDVSYDLTLWYKKTASTATSWRVGVSGGSVEWNATTTTPYPASTSSKFMNITLPTSWTVTGLYNSSSRSTNYTHYNINGNLINCYDMTGGTWVIESESYNHLTQIQIFDTSNSNELSRLANITSTLQINSTLREEDTDVVSTGTTNLTVWMDTVVNHAPSNESVTNGLTSYTWDISTTASDNGEYRVEVYWSNGTDAGYLTKTLIISYPTTLDASQYQIDAFTENTFEIRVYYNDAFTPQGLDGGFAALKYSFNSGSNVSMADHSNGTWTATIDTTSVGPGTYGVDVYAEGFALVNQSLSISVSLIHETLPLSVNWSNGNNITFVESTELQVTYQRVNGVNVTNAIVNVTIGSDTWQLIWSPTDQFYSITFNGTDVPPGFGTHSLTILADRTGFLEQSDAANNLILREEPTSLIVTWTNTYNITFVESTILRVTYQMSNGTAIPSATLNVTISGTTWPLVWNGALETYDLKFNGSDTPPGLGTHLLTILADKSGYLEQSDAGNSLILTEEPTSLIVSWTNTNNITYVESTILRVSYQMSNSTAIPSGTLNVTIGGTTW
ncbi:MAG: hypothetical protein KAR33_09145, partial [Candidatus Thorarchaeota archaeon]|nr:hypothetical protein [Candidatus Thorarchaeota archaeon]